jgi:TetR/AcrR family transcriptional repressor of mexJK operon
MRERKATLIVETARELFLSHGYGGTSLDDVATASGVSKTTVYNNFEDKDALFTAVITDVIDRAQVIASELETGLSGSGVAPDRIRAAARQIIVAVLDPRVVQLRRLAIAEALRFPDLVELYWTHAPARTLEILRVAFARMNEVGELNCPDAVSAANHFAYAVLGPTQDLALLNPRAVPKKAELLKRADLAADAFFRAYSPPGDQRPPS